MGILEAIRKRFGGWFGSKQSRNTPQGEWLESEKVAVSYAAATGGIKFMPYLDKYTAETAAHRKAYREMLREPTVKASCLSKLLNVASLDLSVNAAKSKDNPDRARTIAEFNRDSILGAAGGVRGICEAILFGAMIDGFSVSEKVWKYQEKGQWAGKVMLKALKPKDPEEQLRIEIDAFNNVIAIVGTGRNSGERYDPANFVIFRHLPLFDNPAGMSDFRAAYQKYWMVDTTWKLRMIHADKWSTPFLVGHCSANDLDQMKRALAAAKGSSWAVVPEQAKVEAMNLAGQSADIYQSIILDLRQEISLSITGAFLQAIEGTQTGARSIGEVHKDSAEIFIWHLSACASDAINDQIIPDQTDLNYVTDEYPKAELGAVNEEDLAKALIVDEGLQRMGLPLSKDEMYRKYSRGAPTSPEDILTAPTAPLSPQYQGPAVPFRPFPQSGNLLAETPPTNKKLPIENEIALAGRDGDKAEELLAKSKGYGLSVIADISQNATQRWLASGRIGPFFTKDEIVQFADMLASVNSTAELLGRSRVRQRFENAVKYAEDASIVRYSENPFVCFTEPIAPFSPESALEFFRRLIPKLGADPETFGRAQRRQAFTVAEATSQTLVERIKNAILQRLESGENTTGTPQHVQQILEDAGVSPKNPQYAEMVVRTNMMDSYNQGAELERQDPDVMDAFPVWQYLGILDGREGADHRPHFDKYYPATVNFGEVRGPRVFNCRCTFAPVFYRDWADLYASGVRVADGYQQVVPHEARNTTGRRAAAVAVAG